MSVTCIEARSTKTLWYVTINEEQVIVPRWSGRHCRSYDEAVERAERILAKRAKKI